MRKELILSCLIVIVVLFGGCVTDGRPSPTPAPSPVPIIYINGIVLDHDGTPISGARVALWQGDQPVQTPENMQYTNDAGFFNFTNLQPAHYQVTAHIQDKQGIIDRRFNESTSIEVTIPGYSVSTITPAPGQGPVSPDMPRFTVTRTGPATVEVRLVSFGKVTSLRGFYVKSPIITQREIAPVDSPLGEKWSATITDPNLMGTVDFVASSWVNGNYAIVVNTTL
jgi:hypothetical protein